MSQAARLSNSMEFENALPLLADDLRGTKEYSPKPQGFFIIQLKS